MIFKLTTEHCEVSDEQYQHIITHLNKINQSLPEFESDLIVFRLVIRKNIDLYHPVRTHPHQHISYADKKPEIAYFEGSMTFRLDKNQLYSHFNGQTIDECINLGFKRIYKELEKYKDSHFPAESEYTNHSTIRGGI